MSVLAAVAAVGVGLWAGMPGRDQDRVRIGGTGTATATGPGSAANSGVTGPPTLPGPVVVDGTGAARAGDGGSANSGVQLS